MKWMRRTALGIGIAFSLLYLTLGIGEAIQEGFQNIPTPYDCVLLFFGPFSMIMATSIAWKWERVGAWWLIAGGVIAVILFAIRLSDRPMNLLWTFLSYSAANASSRNAMAASRSQIHQGSKTSIGYINSCLMSVEVK